MIRRPNFYSCILLFQAILIFSWIDFKSSKYDKYVFPGWADALGFLITLSSICLIPGIAIYKVVVAYHGSDNSLVEVSLLRCQYWLTEK